MLKIIVYQTQLKTITSRHFVDRNSWLVHAGVTVEIPPIPRPEPSRSRTRKRCRRAKAEAGADFRSIRRLRHLGALVFDIFGHRTGGETAISVLPCLEFPSEYPPYSPDIRTSGADKRTLSIENPLLLRPSMIAFSVRISTVKR